MDKIIKTLLISLMVLLMSSCKTGTKLISTISDNENFRIWKGEMVKMPVIKSMDAVKVQVRAEIGKDSYRTAAICKIIADSSIQISFLPFLGMEMYKIEMYKDKIMIFDKVNKRFYQSDYTTLNKYLNVQTDLNLWQGFFLNRPVVVADNCSLTKVLKSDSTDVYIWKGNNLQQQFSFDRSKSLSDCQINSNTGDFSMKINYSDFYNTDSINFPNQRKISIKNKNLMIKFDVNLIKLSLNKPVTLKPEEPSTYMPESINQLFKNSK